MSKRSTRFVVALALFMMTGCGGAQPTASAPEMDRGGYYGGAGDARVTSANEAAPDYDSDSAKSEDAPPAPPMMQSRPEPVAGNQGGGQGGAGGGSSTPSGPSVEERRSPILIYTADLALAVYEVQKSVDAVQVLAEKAGGYLARRSDRSITVRVLATEFQRVVAEIDKLGEVTARNITTEDVTAEFRDLEVQLKNAVAMRDRFAKLLEKADKVSEALQIERELGRVTDTIERIKGRLKLLADLARFSTITVNFAAKGNQSVQQGPFTLPLPWLQNLGLPRLMRL